MVLTYERHAMYFPYFMTAKGSELTLLDVNSNHWRAAQLTPESPLLPIYAIWEPPFYSRTMRVLDAKLPESHSALEARNKCA